jgi:hypothetical protein
MVNELRTSITQQVIRKDTGDKLQAFAISMFFKGKSNQSSRIQENVISVLLSRTFFSYFALQYCIHLGNRLVTKVLLSSYQVLSNLCACEHIFD